MDRQPPAAIMAVGILWGLNILSAAYARGELMTRQEPNRRPVKQTRSGAAGGFSWRLTGLALKSSGGSLESGLKSSAWGGQRPNRIWCPTAGITVRAAAFSGFGAA